VACMAPPCAAERAPAAPPPAAPRMSHGGQSVDVAADAGAATLVDTVIHGARAAGRTAPCGGECTLSVSVLEAVCTVTQRHRVGAGAYMPAMRARGVAAPSTAGDALAGHIIAPVARLSVRKLPECPSLRASTSADGASVAMVCTVQVELYNALCQAWDDVVAPWPVHAEARLQRLWPPRACVPIPDSPAAHSDASSPGCSWGGREEPAIEQWRVCAHVTAERLLDVVVSDATANAVHALGGLADAVAAPPVAPPSHCVRGSQCPQRALTSLPLAPHMAPVVIRNYTGAFQGLSSLAARCVPGGRCAHTHAGYHVPPCRPASRTVSVSWILFPSLGRGVCACDCRIRRLRNSLCTR
jgi:hypothetical protein